MVETLGFAFVMVILAALFGFCIGRFMYESVQISAVERQVKDVKITLEFLLEELDLQQAE